MIGRRLWHLGQERSGAGFVDGSIEHDTAGHDRRVWGVFDDASPFSAHCCRSE